jgi:hypothetical protein
MDRDRTTVGLRLMHGLLIVVDVRVLAQGRILRYMDSEAGICASLKNRAEFVAPMMQPPLYK